MYDPFLRHKTNPLQDDLRSEMANYNMERDRLLLNLSHLHHPPPSSQSAVSETQETKSTEISSSRSSKFFRAPNLVRQNSVETFEDSEAASVQSPEQKWKDRKEHSEKMRKEKELLKLPVIHSASNKRSEWESGNVASNKSTAFPILDPLPGIATAKAFLSESMKIPAIHDPQRTDTVFNSKGKKENKKVTFADENHGKLLSINHIEPNDTQTKIKNAKNSERKGPVPKLSLSSNQFSYTAKPVRPKKTSLLPPLDITATDLQINPAMITNGVNEWKSMYTRILNPEQKMRALTDIMNAVRLKKYENEQAMKYGAGPRPMESEELVKQFLNMNGSSQVTYRDEYGNVSCASSWCSYVVIVGHGFF